MTALTDAERAHVAAVKAKREGAARKAAQRHIKKHPTPPSQDIKQVDVAAAIRLARQIILDHSRPDIGRIGPNLTYGKTAVALDDNAFALLHRLAGLPSLKPIEHSNGRYCGGCRWSIGGRARRFQAPCSGCIREVLNLYEARS